MCDSTASWRIALAGSGLRVVGSGRSRRAIAVGKPWLCRFNGEPKVSNTAPRPSSRKTATENPNWRYRLGLSDTSCCNTLHSGVDAREERGEDLDGDRIQEYW